MKDLSYSCSFGDRPTGFINANKCNLLIYLLKEALGVSSYEIYLQDYNTGDIKIISGMNYRSDGLV